MKFSLLVFTLTLLSLTAYAQQTATTQDGRKVILNSDGTWKFAGPRKPKNSASVTIQAGVVYKTGDVNPVARETFYLLDDSLGAILEGAGLRPTRPDKNQSLQDQLMTSYVYAICYGQYPFETRFLEDAQKVIAPHLIKSGQTDFAGKAVIDAIAPGVYFVMGIAKTRGGFAVWNERCEARAGENSLTLDQNNAIIAF
jgi:hypothetical protein